LHPLLAQRTQAEIEIDPWSIPFHVEVLYQALVMEDLGVDGTAYMSTYGLDAWGLAQAFHKTNVAVILGFLIVLHVGLAVGVQTG
jgi:hypothetical protein